MDNIKWEASLPEKPGKYIVKTKSFVLGTENVMYAIFHIDERGRSHWSFKNQIFIEYLKEN